MENLSQIASPPVRKATARVRTPHQQRVDAFMRGAQQALPPAPALPDDRVRELRARLIFEEAMETINALGVEVVFELAPQHNIETGETITVSLNRPDMSASGHDEVTPHSFYAHQFPSTLDSLKVLSNIADGCADISVVTTGTLSACGIADDLLQQEVDNNNLLKFADGYRIDAGGKLIKPPGHPLPRIRQILTNQR